MSKQPKTKPLLADVPVKKAAGAIHTKGVFQKKIDRANEILKTVGLPKEAATQQ